MKKNFDAQGIAASGGPPEQLGKLACGDYERWVKVVVENRIALE